MFKFTIRDLLWLTVVVALGVAWWLTYRELADARAFRSKLVEIHQSGYGWPHAERIWIEPTPPRNVDF